MSIQNSPKVLAVDKNAQLEQFKNIYNNAISKLTVEAEAAPLPSEQTEINEPKAVDVTAPLDNGVQNIFDTLVDQTPTNADIIAATSEPVNAQEESASEPSTISEEPVLTPNTDVPTQSAEIDKSLTENNASQTDLAVLIEKITKEMTEVMVHCANADTLLEELIEKYGLKREKLNSNGTELKPATPEPLEDSANIFDEPAGGMHM